MSKYSSLEELEETIFEQTMESGCQMASAGLSGMLKIPVKVTGMVMGFIPVSDVVLLTGNPEGIVTAARVALSGEISGHMIFMLPPKSWAACEKLLRAQLPGMEIEISAFSELANIACSSFISNLSDLLQIPIPFTPPEVLEDMTATVLEDTLIQFSESRPLLTVETIFSSAKAQIKGFFFFVPSQESVKVMTSRFLRLSRTGKK